MGFLVVFEGAHTEGTRIIDTFGAEGKKDVLLRATTANRSEKPNSMAPGLKRGREAQFSEF